MTVMGNTTGTFINADDSIANEELKNQIIYRINNGGAGGGLDREITESDIDFSRAYTAFNGAGLTKTKDYSRENMIERLKDNGYFWQLPVFIDDDTVLIYIEYDEEENNWSPGLISVYQGEHVDYKENAISAINNWELPRGNYAFVFANGIEAIRYPVAIGFSVKGEAEFIIPAEKASTHVFNGVEAELLYEDGLDEEKASDIKNELSAGNSGAGNFYLYDFKDTMELAENSNGYIGSGGTGLNGNLKNSLKNGLILLPFAVVCAMEIRRSRSIPQAF